MQKNFPNLNFGRLLEDLLALGQHMRGDTAKAVGQAQLEKLLQKMNLVTRAEFEAVQAIAIAARTQAEELAEFLAQNAGFRPSSRKSVRPSAKPPAKKSAKKAKPNTGKKASNAKKARPKAAQKA